MNIDLILKIAALGMLLAVLNQVLRQAGREDIATLCTLSGLVVVLLLVVNLVSDLFSSINAFFSLY